MSNQRVFLQLERVICRDETGGGFVEKVGNDEISLSVIGIDATGTVAKLDPFEIGNNFDDREVRIFNPPKTLFSLAVPDAGAFPKNCIVVFILAEVGGNGTGHQKATQTAFDEATRLVAGKKADLNGDGKDPENTPDWTSTVWELVVDAFVAGVNALVAGGLEDDVFPPRLRSVTITSPDFHFPDGSKQSPDESAVFTAHDGKYEVVYFWQVETVA